MSSRLVLCVVFVTLCWGFMGTTVAANAVSINITVESLGTPVSNAECGTKQLCVAEPADCDPSKEEPCFFLGAKQQSGLKFEFALSGQSEGYIAASVASVASGTTPGPRDPTYVCANDSVSVQFFGTVIKNGKLVENDLSVTSVKGILNGTRIQCAFTATITDSRLRTLFISSGSFKAAKSFGTLKTKIRTTPVDLTDVNATYRNLENGSSVTHQQSLIPALLFSWLSCFSPCWE